MTDQPEPLQAQEVHYPKPTTREWLRAHRNVAFGHTHDGELKMLRLGGTGETLIARNCACLCKLQPLWHHSDPGGWTNGYNLEACRDNGDFLSLHIPIVNGDSMLKAFAGVLAL